MPAVLVLLVGAHLAIFRHNGSAGPVVEDPRTLKVGRFWPDQMFMDGAFSFIVFVIICFLAFAFPPYLDAKADPTKFFVPYPAWYFLSLFGLLALVPPELHLGPLTIGTELIATIVVPTLFLWWFSCFRGSTAAERGVSPRARAYCGRPRSSFAPSSDCRSSPK